MWDDVILADAFWAPLGTLELAEGHLSISDSSYSYDQPILSLER